MSTLVATTPSSLISLCRISFAAASEKVKQRIVSGLIFDNNIFLIRFIKVKVLPVPGPASTIILPLISFIHSCCFSFGFILVLIVCSIIRPLSH